MLGLATRPSCPTGADAHPGAGPGASQLATVRPVLIEDRAVQAGGGSVPWRLIVPESAVTGRCILWLLGWSSGMDAQTAVLGRVSGRVGVACATLDTAGHGRHDEIPLEETTPAQQFAEVVAVMDELSAAGYRDVVVLGNSYGGYLAALLVGERPARALVLQAPANSPDDEFARRADATGFARDPSAYLRRMGTPAVLDRSAATEAVRAFDGPVYVIEHERDEVVPSAVPRHYVAVARRGSHVVVPGLAHSPATMDDPERHGGAVEDVLASVLIQAFRG
jgi:pimeloyl-ACP methyl ester carboxylesterase